MTNRHRTEHTLTVSAPPRTLYDLAADVTLWPAAFGPTVYVRHFEHTARQERFQLWAVVNGQVTSWVSRRTLHPEELRIVFHQEHSRPPFAAMSGEWIFRELPDGRCRIVLVHDFTPVDDSPRTLASITAALDRNSPEELAALARLAGLGHPLRDVIFSFTDVLPLRSAVADAYDFVHRADLWAERLPHVGSVRLSEPSPGVQELEMETVTADGSAHTTRSFRVCQDGEWIAYKQLRMPKLLLGHSGLWTFSDGDEGPVATARHTVALNPAAVTEVLGEGSTLGDARAYVREALGNNSRTTLSYAAAAVEGSR
ncbi:aromatase/cyclase [Streptomyces sp. LUP30]|uniref:aromatase/cyclase n=1 Tax=Streptomyces sp. LUP30 TaxID=1890285 RepID=UPI000851C987|nr:aromatase/cyclase [Streptomyces sp. LUP30]